MLVLSTLWKSPPEELSSAESSLMLMLCHAVIMGSASFSLLDAFEPILWGHVILVCFMFSQRIHFQLKTLFLDVLRT